MADLKRTRDPLEWVKKKAAEAQEAADKRAEETPVAVQMFLPGMEEFMRAMPNHIARSSLFAPVATGRKKIHDGTVLVSRGDALIRFKGKQLDETQADVWMQAMHEACKQPLGEPVIINRAAFLKAIGRNTSGENYKWLHRTMEDLAFAMLVIEVQKDGKPKLAIGRTRALHMIEGFDYDDKSETYTLRIDPRWRGMYGNREFALIDWDKRLQFGQHQNMAKALQRLVATSDEAVQRYTLEWLKSKLEYSSPMRKFRESLEAALRELERLEIIAGGRIEANTRGKPQAVWTKL
jgi:TrfA protein